MASLYSRAWYCKVVLSIRVSPNCYVVPTLQCVFGHCKLLCLPQSAVFIVFCYTRIHAPHRGAYVDLAAATRDLVNASCC